MEEKYANDLWDNKEKDSFMVVGGGGVLELAGGEGI